MKKGDRVICKIDERSGARPPYGISKGVVYTIEDTSTCACGKPLLHLKECRKISTNCGTTNVFIGINNAYYQYRFEKVIDDWVEKVCEEVKQLAELDLDKKPVEVKQYLQE